MTAQRNELYDLVGALPDDQVVFAIADLRKRLPRASASPTRAWPPKFFGGGVDKEGRTDLSENVDDYLAQGFGRPRS